MIEHCRSPDNREKIANRCSTKSNLQSKIKSYFKGAKVNSKELRRFDRQSIRRQILVNKGKEPVWKVVPAAVIDLDLVKENIIHLFERICSNYIKDMK